MYGAGSNSAAPPAFEFFPFGPSVMTSRTPDCPAINAEKSASGSLPSGEITPTPVTTTRLMAGGTSPRDENAVDQRGAEAPGGVDDRADHHRARLPSTRDRLMFDRRDDEPRHERRKDRAEEDRGDPERCSAAAFDHRHHDRAPDAAPERERDHRRNAERRHGLHRPRRARRDTERVQQREHALVKHERGDETGGECDHDAFDHHSTLRK